LTLPTLAVEPSVYVIIRLPPVTKVDVIPLPVGPVGPVLLKNSEVPVAPLEPAEPPFKNENKSLAVCVYQKQQMIYLKILTLFISIL
jgi:hypothetical protein